MNESPFGLKQCPECGSEKLIPVGSPPRAVDIISRFASTKLHHKVRSRGARRDPSPSNYHLAMVEQVTVTKEIAAPVEQVWAMVSDLTRMGEWSPENEGAVWLRGATGPTLGATFRGMNRNGKKKWNTLGGIDDAQPERLLAFRITAAGFKVAEWRYEFEPTATGCRVIETWVDLRGHIAKALGKPVSGVADRAAHNRATMEQTLERLKLAAESTASSTQ